MPRSKPGASYYTRRNGRVNRAGTQKACVCHTSERLCAAIVCNLLVCRSLLETQRKTPARANRAPNRLQFVGLPTKLGYAMIALEEERKMGERRTESRQTKRLRVARRSMTYIVRTLLLIILACIVCIGAFLTAERMSNLYILASEGMALRADCVIADGARNDLEEYFTLTFPRKRPRHVGYDVFELHDLELQLRPRDRENQACCHGPQARRSPPWNA